MSLTLSEEYPTARKEHCCHDCGRIIERGEKYRRWSGIDDDAPYTWKSCGHCDKVYAAIWSTEEARYMVDEGIDIGEWLTEYQIEPLATQWRNRWVGIDLVSLDVSVVNRPALGVSERRVS